MPMKKLKAIRLAHGLTQEALAKRMRRTQEHVAQLEAGRDPRLSTVRRVAKALGVPISALVD